MRQKSQPRGPSQLQPPVGSDHTSGHPVRALSAAPFLTSIAAAAFLLFSLELLAGRLVLPVFGGAAAVWTTTLCFFTATLFLAYLYAHLAATRLSVKAGSRLQLALAVVVVGATFAAPESVATLRTADLPAAFNVLMALAIVAGPAGFLLASTTPLLSAWYAEGHVAPWWLYAVSNAASFLALVLYPFVIAPAIPLSVQRSLLVFGLIAYAASLTWVALVLRGRENSVPPASLASEPLDYPRQLRWLLAAAIPAGLMSATTNFVQTDLAATPLVWVGPLGVYLASFVIAFSARGRQTLRIVERLAPVAATLMWVPFTLRGLPAVPLLVSELVALLVLTTALHGRLAADRPSEARLTWFYLVVSLGGLLATAFVALVAPVIFSSVLEYPVLIVAGLVLLAVMPGPSTSQGIRVTDNPVKAAGELGWRLVPYGLMALFLYSSFENPELAPALARWLLAGAVVVVFALTPRLTAGLTLVALAFLLIVTDIRPLVRMRTFFGVTQVQVSGNAHGEYSGTTLHGLQFTDERSSEPTLYYARVGPLSGVFDDLRERATEAAIGVVGLGTGTVAAYARSGDQLSFFEIDQAVVDIATNPDYFTYLSDSAVPPRVVLGDGRLSLAREAPGSFNLLILDAFSSDVVPAHLLTREAIEIYIRALRPGGVLAFHVSSRFYRLAEPVGATARSLGLSAAARSVVLDLATSERTGGTDSLWVVVGAAGDVGRFLSRGWVSLEAGEPVLTDDYSDLTSRLMLGWR